MTETCASMSWDMKSEDTEWIGQCAVGVLKRFSNISNVNTKLYNMGFRFFSTYLGDKCIIWEFETEADCEDFIKQSFFWAECFSSMLRWADVAAPKSRMVWINCVGIPLRCWCEEFFKKIGWTLGEPLLIDEDTRIRNTLERGRILILTPFGVTNPNKIKVIEWSHSFEILIEEEATPVNFSWLVQHLGLKPKDDTTNSKWNHYPVLDKPGGFTAGGEHMVTSRQCEKLPSEQPPYSDRMDDIRGDGLRKSLSLLDPKAKVNFCIHGNRGADLKSRSLVTVP
ncbi:hypothetical protein Dsin_007300 [Dipteronia sinensis]|uniref:DUF4283 domain-containing protein n=1 Tax=Dipteronia sinensis TaxID=43782 RepID=A0AAE0EGC7_9ROSI|nr:hypothetical protein Dsin_007300 [Dipteronia sinensis]